MTTRTTCLYCGRKLRPDIIGRGLGYDGNGWFDTLRCGYKWALLVLERKVEVP